MTTVILVMWYFNFTKKFQFTKMVRVGDVFCHDSSCSAQTKFNSTGGIHTAPATANFTK